MDDAEENVELRGPSRHSTRFQKGSILLKKSREVSYRDLYPLRAKRSRIVGLDDRYRSIKLSVNDSEFIYSLELKRSLDNPGDGHFESLSHYGARAHRSYT